MKISENITISQTDKEKILNLNYISTLTNNLSLEYSNLPFNSGDNSNENIKKIEMTKTEDYFTAEISFENTPEIYFRILNENNEIVTIDTKQDFIVSYDNIKEASENITTGGVSENSETINNSSTYVVSEEVNNEGTSTEIDNGNTYPQLDNINVPTSLAMVPIKEQNLMYAKHGLRFTYRLNKKIRLILYKLFQKLPSFITGNYRRRINL